MSRNSTSSSKQLSLTEELEKLEQSITLTLQEIDHNFSRAHRIVSSRILPIVEQYGDHSKAVWEGSKFWKQFFESSANVSLSGVEERDEEEEELSYTQSHERASTYAGSTSQAGDNTLGDEQEEYNPQEDSLLESGDISGSTPRPPKSKGLGKGEPDFAEYSSPYEALKEEIRGVAVELDDEQDVPRTPKILQSRLPNMSMTPKSSPFDPTIYMQSIRKPGQDPLLHRVLDKNYRVHATPHTVRKEKDRLQADKPSWRDTASPMSSPPVAAPQLHADIFDSPIRQQYSRPTGPRTPGISVQTPARGNTKRSPLKSAKRDEISWESDSDEDAEGVFRDLGMSPPKTIQFSLPQSRLLQTPAREASKRIVEDLLNQAGAGLEDTNSFDDSPSVVAMKEGLDDSF